MSGDNPSNKSFFIVGLDCLIGAALFGLTIGCFFFVFLDDVVDCTGSKPMPLTRSSISDRLIRFLCVTFATTLALSFGFFGSVPSLDDESMRDRDTERQEVIGNDVSVDGSMKQATVPEPSPRRRLRVKTDVPMDALGGDA